MRKAYGIKRLTDARGETSVYQIVDGDGALVETVESYEAAIYWINQQDEDNIKTDGV